MTAEPHQTEEILDAETDATDSAQDPDWGQPYRDGKVHVMAEKCGTCVFHPGNRMHLSPGRLADMADHVKETGVPFACHQTLSYAADKYRDHYGGNALCRGAVDAYGDQSMIMRMAHAVGNIEEVEPYPYDPADPHGYNADHATDH